MNKNTRAFNIVELLITIVIIAILASITIAAYTGIQSRARQSANYAAIDQYIKAFKIMKVNLGSLPVGNYANASCMGPSPSPETCDIGSQPATGSSSYTENMKVLLADAGMTNQPAIGIAYTKGYIVYTSTFYGESALLWQVPADQDCTAQPGRFVRNTNVRADNLKYSYRSSSITSCYMSLANI